jgi:hypothetical protein
VFFLPAAGSWKQRCHDNQEQHHAANPHFLHHFRPIPDCISGFGSFGVSVRV